MNDDTFRVVNGIIKPTLNFIARGLLSFLIILSLLIYNFTITILLFVTLCLAYIFIFSKFRGKIEKYGNDLTIFQTNKIKHINETFLSIKDIQILNKFSFFEKYFYKIISKISESHVFVNFINISPRYLIDAVGFGFIILLIIILKIYVKEDLTKLLTSVSFLVFSSYKLIPAFQEIYSSLVLLKNNKVALDNLIHLLDSEQEFNKNYSHKKLIFKKYFSVSNISFNYQKNKPLIFNNCNFKIIKHKSHLIFGKTGSGKSTILEILLGFLDLKNFNFSIDDVETKNDILYRIRNSCSYVSQSPILIDESILDNICFGSSNKKVNKNLLQKALKYSCSDEFINKLDKGINTNVGERGVTLSGGQRQRISLARAIYQNKDLLILDEATNALDEQTEDNVIKNLTHYLNKTLIVVSHNAKIKKQFENIYTIKDKKIIKTK